MADNLDFPSSAEPIDLRLPAQRTIPTPQQHAAIDLRLEAVSEYLPPQHLRTLDILRRNTYNPALIEMLAQPLPPLQNDSYRDEWVQGIAGPLSDIANTFLQGLQQWALPRKRQSSRSGTLSPERSQYGLSYMNDTPDPDVEYDPIERIAINPSGVNTPRSRRAVLWTSLRDGHRCTITWKSASSGFQLDCVHIISHGLAKNESMRSEPFWKMLELFIGHARVDALWEYVSGGNVNRHENLMLLEPSLHRLFDKGIMALVPIGLLSNPQDQISEPYLDIEFQWWGPDGQRSPPPGSITTFRDANVLNQTPLDSARALTGNDSIRIVSHFTPQDGTARVPLPSRDLLHIHTAVNRLRHLVGAAEPKYSLFFDTEDEGEFVEFADTSLNDDYDDPDLFELSPYAVNHAELTLALKSLGHQVLVSSDFR